MALPPSTANWHWKNKNVKRWGTEWFERELTNINVMGENEGDIISIHKVTEVDGDMELGQRKSKLITIYDCKIVLDWKGIASDGTEVKGSLTIPEVSHEITLDRLSDYVYNWSLTTTPRSPEVDSIYRIAQSRLPPALEAKFAEFPVALIETHGKDLTISADPSRSGTPAPGGTSAPIVAPTSAPIQPKQVEVKTINTKVVKVEATFQASADDLFNLLTDEKRIPMWTRAPAKSIPEVGSEISLFGGGVKGKYVSLSPPREIVQTWALQSPTWPAGHDGTLTTTLDQTTDSTRVTFSLVGVPTGLEDEIKRNIEGYYIHGLKSIGYVQIIQYEPIYAASSQKPRVSKRPLQTPQSTSTSYIPAIAIACLVLAAAFAIPYLSSPSLLNNIRK